MKYHIIFEKSYHIADFVFADALSYCSDKVVYLFEKFLVLLVYFFNSC